MFIELKLIEFARMHPGIALTATFNNRTEDLIAAEVDVAVRITSTPPLDHDDTDIHSIPVQPTLQSSDYSFLAEAVRSGMRIGLLPIYVMHMPTNRDLLPILPEYRVIGQQFTLYIVTLSNRYPSPSIRALIDFLREQILARVEIWSQPDHAQFTPA